jgi:hypothetical protein
LVLNSESIPLLANGIWRNFLLLSWRGSDRTGLKRRKDATSHIILDKKKKDLRLLCQFDRLFSIWFPFNNVTLKKIIWNLYTRPRIIKGRLS